MTKMKPRVSLPKVEIAKLSSDSSGAIGYAEGKLNEREFTVSWATWQPLGALFFDTWLDSTKGQDKAIARALRKMNAIPEVQVASGSR